MTQMHSCFSLGENINLQWFFMGGKIWTGKHHMRLSSQSKLSFCCGVAASLGRWSHHGGTSQRMIQSLNRFDIKLLPGSQVLQPTAIDLQVSWGPYQWPVSWGGLLLKDKCRFSWENYRLKSVVMSTFKNLNCLKIRLRKPTIYETMWIYPIGGYPQQYFLGEDFRDKYFSCACLSKLLKT